MVVLLVALALPLMSTATDYTILGGETLDVEDSAISVQVGFPELSFRYHIPVLENFEIAPSFTFAYNGSFGGGGIAPGALSTHFGADFKLALLDKGDFHLALRWETSFFLMFGSGGSGVLVGMKLGIPGAVAMDYKLSNSVRLVFGLNMPLALTFTSPVLVGLPMEFEVGAEFNIAENINMSVEFELGPTFIAAGGFGSAVNFHFAGLIGIEYLID